MAKKVVNIDFGAWGVEINSRNPFIERSWFPSQNRRDRHFQMMKDATKHGSLEGVSFTKIHRVM